MKCFNHETRPAEGACVTCGKTFCRDCLVELDGAYFCKEHIIAKIKQKREDENKPPKKSKLLALILAMFFGVLGIHRFYLGRHITGFIWLFTGGFFGVGWMVDILLIAMDVLPAKGALSNKKST